MKVVVDREKCDGLGICEGLAPQVFEIGDDGQLQLLTDHVDASVLQDVESAVASCPMAALRLTGS